MSAISQKSISGITSITTPAGIDNQFTLHTNDTSQAAKLDSAGNFHFSNHVNTTGITSASNFKASLVSFICSVNWLSIPAGVVILVIPDILFWLIADIDLFIRRRHNYHQWRDYHL